MTDPLLDAVRKLLRHHRITDLEDGGQVAVDALDLAGLRTVERNVEDDDAPEGRALDELPVDPLAAARGAIDRAFYAASEHTPDGHQAAALAAVATALIELAHAEATLTPRAAADERAISGDTWERLVNAAADASELLHTIGAHLGTAPSEAVDSLLGWAWPIGQAIGQAASDRAPGAVDLRSAPWSRMLRMDYVEGQPAAGDPDRIILYLERKTPR